MHDWPNVVGPLSRELSPRRKVQLRTHLRITGSTTDPVNLDLASWISTGNVGSQGRVHATVEGRITRAFDWVDR